MHQVGHMYRLLCIAFADDLLIALSLAHHFEIFLHSIYLEIHYLFGYGKRVKDHHQFRL
jgi:hypothetical protein